MVFNRFTFILLVRLVLILINMVILAIMYLLLRHEHLLFSSVALILLLVFQIYGLVRQISTTNRELSKLIYAINNKDYSFSFPSKYKSRSFQELAASLNETIQNFKNVKLESESKLQYLQLIVENMDIGIITLNERKEISLINNPAKELLEIPDLIHWKTVKEKHSGFSIEVDRLKGYRRCLVEIETSAGIRQLSVIVSSIMLLDEPYKIVTFQDIKSEIERKETEAWHKLIRILNHEIMNSVTPLASLTETILLVLENENGEQKLASQINEVNIRDIRTCVRTIKKRSENLLAFIEEYRKLTKIPEPRPEKINVAGLFRNISSLMTGEMEKKKIELEIVLKDPDLVVEADGKQIEQVLINLMNNSIYFLAATPKPKIRLTGYVKDENIIIQVSDNGSGITQEDMNKIFVPFYSSKKEGTGIGLSLSKHIMQLHEGDLRVKSTPNKETVFSLIFQSLSRTPNLSRGTTGVSRRSTSDRATSL